MPDEPPNRPAQRRKLRHLELLVTLVALIVIQSFLSAENRWQRAAVNVLFLLVTFAAIRALSKSRIRLWATLTLGVAAYGLSWVVELTEAPLALAVIDLSFIAIFALLVLTVAEDVFRSGPVDADRILGAVTIYFLLALGWAFVYSLLESWLPGSFRSNVAEEISHDASIVRGQLIYFSQVTLTTLGYGDIVPASAPARMLASLEAIVGQLYLTIVVARLVGLQISQGGEAVGRQ